MQSLPLIFMILRNYRGIFGRRQLGTKTWDILNQFTVKSNTHPHKPLPIITFMYTNLYKPSTSPFRSVRHEVGWVKFIFLYHLLWLDDCYS